MQANTDGNHAADPPKVSDSGLGDSPSAFLLNSKLRNKLAKLARWRRDPSLIEFHEDTPEFRGGFATVSRAFLTLFPNDNEVGDESEHTADERPDPDAGNPSSGDLDALSQRETGEHGDNHTDKDEGTDSRLVDGDNEKTNQKGREESNDHREQGTLPQYSITTIGGESVSSEHAVDEDPGYSSNLDAQSQSGTQRPEGEQVKVEEATSHVANAKNDQTKEEEDSNRQTSQKKIHDVTLGLDYLHDQEPPIYHGDLKSVGAIPP
ncbi:hypothetical protein FRC01_000201 [Tulasnella sp. 417]|nr:hypothetical protein FRC01_000201 [Tulasnella sp. 417]